MGAKRTRWLNLTCRETTLKRLNECKELFVERYPEFKYFKITNEIMLSKLIDKFMEDYK